MYPNPKIATLTESFQIFAAQSHPIVITRLNIYLIITSTSSQKLNLNYLKIRTSVTTTSF